MVYLAKGGFWLNMGQGISSFAGLALAVIFANFLPAETYGTYKFVISFIGILSIPTLSGINTALIRAVAQGNEGTLYPALKVKLKWGVWGALGALIISGYYFYNNNTTLGSSFLIMAFFIPFFNTLNIWVQYLNGKKDFKTLGKYKAFYNIITISIVISTVIVTQNIFIILFVYFISNSLTRLFFLKKSTKKHPINKNYDKASIKYGKHLSLMSILGPISKQIDKILIFHYLGPIQLAIYAFSLRPIEELNGLLDSFSKLSLPKLSQRSMPELKKSIPKKMIKLFIILIILVTIYIIISPYLYQKLFPQYIEATIYSQVFALSIIFFPKMLIGQTLTAHARKKQLYILRTLTPLFKIFLLLILLPIYGIWGAIITLIASELFHLILLLLFFKKMK
ncbi:oligosaccharide flippase family protein [bacterium]|nr:oligosaccharide flippase family protein [bacterium]